MSRWHEGRTFYACPCGARHELTGDDAPLTVPCWQSHCGGTMAQWIPPAVKRERDATAALSANEGKLL